MREEQGTSAAGRDAREDEGGWSTSPPCTLTLVLSGSRVGEQRPHIIQLQKKPKYMK